MTMDWYLDRIGAMCPTFDVPAIANELERLAGASPRPFTVMAYDFWRIIGAAFDAKGCVPLTARETDALWQPFCAEAWRKAKE
jgi:hypothetical protein